MSHVEYLITTDNIRVLLHFDEKKCIALSPNKKQQWSKFNSMSCYAEPWITVPTTVTHAVIGESFQLVYDFAKNCLLTFQVESCRRRQHA